MTGKKAVIWGLILTFVATGIMWFYSFTTQAPLA